MVGNLSGLLSKKVRCERSSPGEVAGELLEKFRDIFGSQCKEFLEALGKSDSGSQE